MGTLNRQRVFVAILWLAFIAPATEIDAMLTLGTAALISAALSPTRRSVLRTRGGGCGEGPRLSALQGAPFTILHLHCGASA